MTPESAAHVVSAVASNLPTAAISAVGGTGGWWIIRYSRANCYRRASMRRAVRIRWAWKRHAKMLDMAYSCKTGRSGDVLVDMFRGIKTPDRERISVPRIRVRSDEYSVRINAKAVGKINLQRWQENADSLAQLWRVPRVKISSPAPGKIRARAFLREPLDALIPSPLITPAHDGLWLPAVAPGALSPHDDVLLLVDEDGNSIKVNLVKGAHMLIAGATRSGKSITVNTMLGAYSLMHSVRLRIIDANLGTVAPWWRTAHAVCDDIDPDRPTEILREVREEMEKRKSVFWHKRADKLEEFTPELPVEVLVIDELANYAKHPDKKKREIFLAELLAVASQGHKFGVRIILITQKPEADILPTSIRTNLSARICHRVDTPEDFKHCYSGAADMDITSADRAMPAGVAVAQLLGMRSAVRARSAFTPAQACWSISDAICASRGEVRPLPTDGRTMDSGLGELDEAAYLATVTV